MPARAWWRARPSSIPTPAGSAARCISTATSSAIPAAKLREVALMLKAIHAQESCEAARRKAEEVIAKLRAMRLAKAAELVEAAIGETLAYYAFPEEHWRRIRTNNP